ncbi:hypothetical protein BLNAU_3451 [Blattamonas nauphoetae]|uniref:Uncharacterized protein n=1 Tax=Blattamonas nauphoetae TaxID=2049346 RepID=A0ABQ9YD09_9EUKA|nr:hypothetical protein BLNAU_3451 [Blattamonas nauphoetae]
MTRQSCLSRMAPTHFCELSSDLGNAMIAGADEQVLGSPPIVQKWYALVAIHDLFELRHWILVLVVQTGSFISKNRHPSPPHETTRLSFSFHHKVMLSLRGVDNC